MENSRIVKNELRKEESKSKKEIKKLILDKSSTFKFIHKCPHRNVINLNFVIKKRWLHEERRKMIFDSKATETQQQLLDI